MAAAAFFYAGSLEIQWQLLIIVILLFFGTLTFFAVLFDETPTELTEPLITSTVLNVDDESGAYQTNSTSVA
jgi:hypothetical protein